MVQTKFGEDYIKYVPKEAKNKTNWCSNLRGRSTLVLKVDLPLWKEEQGRVYPCFKPKFMSVEWKMWEPEWRKKSVFCRRLTSAFHGELLDSHVNLSSLWQKCLSDWCQNLKKEQGEHLSAARLHNEDSRVKTAFLDEFEYMNKTWMMCLSAKLCEENRFKTDRNHTMSTFWVGDQRTYWTELFTSQCPCD